MAEVGNHLENRSNGYQYSNLPIDGRIFLIIVKIPPIPNKGLRKKINSQLDCAILAQNFTYYKINKMSAALNLPWAYYAIVIAKRCGPRNQCKPCNVSNRWMRLDEIDKSKL